MYRVSSQEGVLEGCAEILIVRSLDRSICRDNAVALSCLFADLRTVSRDAGILWAMNKALSSSSQPTKAVGVAILKGAFAGQRKRLEGGHNATKSQTAADYMLLYVTQLVLIAVCSHKMTFMMERRLVFPSSMCGHSEIFRVAFA